MTTWPSGSKATTTHTDSGSDSPRLARVDINQNILNTNDVIDYFNGGGSITATGDQISFNKGYKETINTLTSSADITVDADTASVHKVTLSHNATFTFSNMTSGQSVSLIVVQNGDSTVNTGIFTSDGSTQIYFPRGANIALTDNTNAIDIINVFYDGVNFYGNMVKDLTNE